MVTLREQIADMLRYLKKADGFWYTRDIVEDHITTMDTSYGNVSVQDILNRAGDIAPDKLLVRGDSYYDDENGQDNSSIELYTTRKQTDNEYWESLADAVSPSEWQLRQYQQYQQLKQMFEPS